MKRTPLKVSSDPPLGENRHSPGGRWINRFTDAVLDEIRDWQSRALEWMYPIVIFDVLRVKVGDAPSRA